ncbi:Bleomycin resistance protein [compost metagenome]
MYISAATPIIRIFDEAKATEFYLDFLGFKSDWEHRFGENFPVYLQVRRSSLILHLSEHYGDATPGSAIFIPIDDIDALHAELLAKDYKNAKPGVEDLPWGRMMDITDPFGNHLRFCQQTPD